MSTLLADPARPTEGDGDDRDRLHRYVVVVLFALVFALAIRPALDTDLWWHLRTGAWMVDHHRWIGVDPFQHTRPGVVRVQTDWLADLTYYGVWRSLGLAGVSLVVAALATIGTVFVHLTSRGRFGFRVAGTAMAAAAASIHWVTRPQMFTFALTAAIAYLVHRWRAAALADDDGAGPVHLWFVVPLVLLGSNLHGGIVYATLILLAMAAGEWLDVVLARLAPRLLDVARRLPVAARRRLMLVTAAAVGVMAVNPSGVRIYGLAFHQVDTAARFVEEVQPPSLDDVWVWPFFALLLASGVVLALTWRRFDGVAVLPLLLTGALALQFVRSVPFFAIVAAPFVVERASRIWPGRGASSTPPLTAQEHRRLRQAVALVVVAVAVSTPFRIGGDGVAEQRAGSYPEAATEWLNENRPPGELFNEFDWGGYLILHAPEYRVSIDGRTDVYDEYLDTAISTAMARPGWEAELDRERIGTILIHRGTPLALALDDEPQWRMAYEDDVAVIFTRA